MDLPFLLFDLWVVRCIIVGYLLNAVVVVIDDIVVLQSNLCSLLLVCTLIHACVVDRVRSEVLDTVIGLVEVHLALAQSISGTCV